MKLRVSLAGLLRHAAECIDGLAGEICEREGMGYDPDQDGDAESPECFEKYEPLYYGFALREAARHAIETEAGQHSVREFAEFYCLRRESEAWVDAIGNL